MHSNSSTSYSVRSAFRSLRRLAGYLFVFIGLAGLLAFIALWEYWITV